MIILRTLALALTAIAASSTVAASPVQYLPAAPGLPFSAGVRVGDTLYLSGEIGALPDGKLAPGGMAGQARQVMANIGAKLESQGLGYDDVFKCTVMLADMSRWAEFNAVYTAFFKPGRLPARSAMGVNALALGAELEVECWAQYPPVAPGRGGN